MSSQVNFPGFKRMRIYYSQTDVTVLNIFLFPVGLLFNDSCGISAILFESVQLCAKVISDGVIRASRCTLRIRLIFVTIISATRALCTSVMIISSSIAAF